MHRFITPDRCRAEIEQYRRDTNPARSFLLDNFVQGFDFDGIETAELYQLYRQWCDDNGYRPMNNANFGKEVRRAFEHVVNEQRCFAGVRKRVYAGLAMIDGSGIVSRNTA